MKKLVAYLGAFFSAFLPSALVFAQDHGTAAASTGGNANVWYAISAGFAIAVAASFGALSQAKAAAAALEGIGRNPGAAGKVQTPMIIALALIESLVIYALVIAFLLQGKIV